MYDKKDAVMIIIQNMIVVRAKRQLERSTEEEAAEKCPCLEGRHNETNDVDSHLANVAIYIHVDNNPVVLEKRPLEKLANEAAEKRPRLEGEHSETSDVDSHSANVAIDSNPIVREKHPLEKLAKETVEKLEGERSE
ncbi:MAG: hypothetical protein MJE68_11540, partial [Proteobacteria bacterium]|nr:hypothetical protein [Pseudomonadota bacterium]